MDEPAASIPSGRDSRGPGTGAEVEQLLADVEGELRALLGETLVGLYVHGSWVLGDFAPARSDIDLLAVLEAEPDEALLADLGGAHTRLAAAYPRWDGRIEVEYVAVETIRSFASGVGAGSSSRIARISPGEPLHLLLASEHRLLAWALVREGGRALVGPAPHHLLPVVDAGVMRAALLLHVLDWRVWVTEMETPGRQSYAVLALCRALHLVREDRQASKRQAAGYAAVVLPHWRALIEWASCWWYGAGSDDEPSRFAETVDFVMDVSAEILRE